MIRGAARKRAGMDAAGDQHEIAAPHDPVQRCDRAAGVETAGGGNELIMPPEILEAAATGAPLIGIAHEYRGAGRLAAVHVIDMVKQGGGLPATPEAGEIEMHADHAQALVAERHQGGDGAARFEAGEMNQPALDGLLAAADEQGIAVPAHALVPRGQRHGAIIRMLLEQPVRKDGVALAEAAIGLLQGDDIGIKFVQHVDDALRRAFPVVSDGLANIVGYSFNHPLMPIREGGTRDKPQARSYRKNHIGSTSNSPVAFPVCSGLEFVMAKVKRRFVCQGCGSVTTRWQGQCDDCGEWNSLVEEAAPTTFSVKHDLQDGGRAIDFIGLDSEVALPERIGTGIAEFDRALGGGLVPGSATLIGGDPGIGKSTLLLQAAAMLAAAGRRVVYVSGEEAADQVRLRARRLGLGHAPVQLASATSVRDILTSLGGTAPDLLVIDSIQTMHSDLIEGAPGTVSQVRASAQELIRFAKKHGSALILVGHVTKDGTLAGPRVLEHMVDTVLAFEGERSHQYRILRAIKNRFGGTDEIGVFAMGEEGLSEVGNPSALFLTERTEGVAGTTVFPALEGTRPVLVEIQALTVRLASGATPRRAVVGWDSGRLAMILAVLEARCGLSFSSCEVYLNVAGGYRLQDPAADLAVAAALVSALAERPVPQETVLLGEIALSGEVRPVAHAALRLREAAKLGFQRAMLPAANAKAGNGLTLSGYARLGELVDHMLGRD